MSHHVEQTIADATWPSVDLCGVTELRVHGVGGTPPSEMLGTLTPVQVSGDRTAGCWRAPDEVDESGVRRHIEAYAWGGLTARSATSALWLLALPFALVNLAGWMAPVRGSRVYDAIVRIAGLAVTGLYVAFACAVSMDFAAYQCAGADQWGVSCATTKWWPIGVGWPAHDPARRVLVGAVVPLALIGVLWWATRCSRRAFEEYDDGRAGSERWLNRHANSGLEHPGFWNGEGYAARLAEVHLAVGFAIVAFLIASTNRVHTYSAVASFTMICAVAMILGGLVLAAYSPLRRRLPPWVAVGLGLALVAVAALEAWFARPRPVAEMPRFLPGSVQIFNIFIGLLVPCAVGLFVAGLWLGRSVPAASRAQRWRWAATPAATITVANMVSLTVLAGFELWVARRLGEARGYRADAAQPPAIEYAQSFEVLARGVVAAFVLVTLTAVSAWLTRGRRQQREGLARARVAWDAAEAPPGWDDARTSPQWLRKVARSYRCPQASLSAAEWAVWVSATAAIFGAGWYSVRWVQEMNRTHWREPHIEVDVGWVTHIPLGLCTWFLTTVPLAAVFVLRRAITSSSTRRTVAIAWDVATFWPRSYHPLAPPSYAERAVPELQARLKRLWDGDGKRCGSVLLLGHSQGSVLVAAALASLPDDDEEPLVERLGVVTYGSPIRRLYARHFPAYFSPELLTRILGRLQRKGSDELAWMNCYRDSDYVGHRLTAEDDRLAGVDRYFVDPPHPFSPPSEPAPPPRSHAELGYRGQALFSRRVTAEALRLQPRLPG